VSEEEKEVSDRTPIMGVFLVFKIEYILPNVNPGEK
jgi:hypothetical protein